MRNCSFLFSLIGSTGVIACSCTQEPHASQDPTVSSSANGGTQAGDMPTTGDDVMAGATSDSGSDDPRKILGESTGLDTLYALGSDPEEIHGVAVDGMYVYFQVASSRFVRAPKDGGGEQETFLNCTQCNRWDLYPSGDRFYTLTANSIIEYDFTTGTQRTLELPWSLSETALLIADDWLYVALRGCPIIVRVERSTLTYDQQSDVFEIPNTPSPGRGRVILASDSKGLYCGGPSEIYAIADWTQSAVKLVPETADLFGLLALHDQIFWMGRDSSTSESAQLGWVPNIGGQSTIATYSRGRGPLFYGAANDRLMHVAGTGVTMLKPGDASSYHWFDAGVGLTAMAVDQTHAYFAVNDFVENSRFHFIARINQEELL